MEPMIIEVVIVEEVTDVSSDRTHRVRTGSDGRWDVMNQVAHSISKLAARANEGIIATRFIGCSDGVVTQIEVLVAPCPLLIGVLDSLVEGVGSLAGIRVTVFRVGNRIASARWEIDRTSIRYEY
jgi:hypothetical protein